MNIIKYKMLIFLQHIYDIFNRKDLQSLRSLTYRCNKVATYICVLFLYE